MSEGDASIETLFRQASMTAHTYFVEAITHIDNHFGEGYAEAHPELIGSFMQTAALDFAACAIHKALNHIADTELQMALCGGISVDSP